jgi:hypothetical protein
MDMLSALQEKLESYIKNPSSEKEPPLSVPEISRLKSISDAFCSKFSLTPLYLENLNEPLPIVSIGSGNGVAEHMIQNHFKQHRIICVDPNPTSCTPFPTNGTKFIQPHYALTQDLVTAEPEIVNQCIVVFIWPNPTGDDNVAYDIEAIALLQPKAVFVVYDYTGSSGSASLIRWIDSLFPKLNLKFRNHMWLDASPEDDSSKPRYNHPEIWYSLVRDQPGDTTGMYCRRVVGLWMTFESKHEELVFSETEVKRPNEVDAGLPTEDRNFARVEDD